MSPLTAIERFFERLFERPSARLFRTHVQPIQIQRRIERAMEAGRRHGIGRTIVPNRFIVHLNPEDLLAWRRSRRASRPGLPTRRCRSRGPITTPWPTGRASTWSPTGPCRGRTSGSMPGVAGPGAPAAASGAAAEPAPQPEGPTIRPRRRVFTVPESTHSPSDAPGDRSGREDPRGRLVAGRSDDRPGGRQRPRGSRRPRVPAPRPDRRTARDARLHRPRQHERVAGERRADRRGRPGRRRSPPGRRHDARVEVDEAPG